MRDEEGKGGALALPSTLIPLPSSLLTTRSMAANRSAGRIGLVWKSSMPAARQRSRSSFLERAVKAMMGRRPPAGNSRSPLGGRDADAGVADLEAQPRLVRNRTDRSYRSYFWSHSHDHL